LQSESFISRSQKLLKKHSKRFLYYFNIPFSGCLFNYLCVFFGEHLMILSNIFVINIIWGEDLMTFWYRECCQEQLIILASDRACQSLNFMLDLFLGPLLCDFNDFFLGHGFSTSFSFRCFHLSDVFHFDAFAACASHLKVHPSWLTDWMNEWMGNELGRSIKWWGKRRWTVNIFLISKQKYSYNWGQHCSAVGKNL